MAYGLSVPSTISPRGTGHELFLHLYLGLVKFTSRLKLYCSSVRPAGGSGTGSDRWIMSIAALSKTASPEDCTTLADITLPRRLSTIATFTVVALFRFGG